MMTLEEAVEAGAVDLNGDGCLHLKDGPQSYIEVYVTDDEAARRQAEHDAATAAMEAEAL